MSADGTRTITADGAILTLKHPAEPMPRLGVHSPDYLYAEKKELRIFTHKPPQPFGSKKYTAPFDVDECITDYKLLLSRSPGDHVFSQPPRDRQEFSKAPEGAEDYLQIRDTTTLVVNDILHAGDGIGAQVVLCDIKSEGPTTYWNSMGHRDHPTQVVAKIYDPLLFPKVHPLADWIRLDTVSCADGEYAREAAAYMELHDASSDPMVRDFVPRFYGTWSTIIENEGWGSSKTRPFPNGGIHTRRPVRIILMEFFDGCPINELYYKRHDENGLEYLEAAGEVSPQEDLNVFARILRGLTALKFHGIFPRSFDTGNFILVEHDTSQDPSKLQRFGDERVIMINHDNNRVWRQVSSLHQT